MDAIQHRNDVVGNDLAKKRQILQIDYPDGAVLDFCYGIKK